MKCQGRLTLFFLLILSIALIPLVHAVTLSPYPDVEIRLSAYDTYLMWTGTLTFDSLTVSASDASFTNIHMGSGSSRSLLDISIINGNLALTTLESSHITEFIVSGFSGTTCTATLMGWSTQPTKVAIDGVDKLIGVEWSYASPTVTLTLPFPTATNKTVRLDWTTPSGTYVPYVPPPASTSLIYPVTVQVSNWLGNPLENVAVNLRSSGTNTSFTNQTDSEGRTKFMVPDASACDAWAQAEGITLRVTAFPTQIIMLEFSASNIAWYYLSQTIWIVPAWLLLIAVVAIITAGIAWHRHKRKY